MNLRDILKTIFIDWQFLGLIIGFGISFLHYKMSKNDSEKMQRIIWKKEFEKKQIDKIINIFRGILLILLENKNAKKLKTISKDLLIKLKTETQLNISFDKEIGNRINKDIYKECLYYNEMGVVKFSDSFSQTESSRIEEEKRDEIEKNIIEVIDKIKSIYSEF